jgi:hypothetical protein
MSMNYWYSEEYNKYTAIFFDDKGNKYKVTGVSGVGKPTPIQKDIQLVYTGNLKTTDYDKYICKDGRTFKR